MKIGILCYPTYGGSGVVATELGEALADRGHEVHFITYEQPFRLRTWHERLYFHVVDVMSYPLFKYPPYTMAAASRIIEVVNAHGLDIVHAHYAVPHTVAALLARHALGNGLRVITTLHGTDITLVGNDPSFSAITRWGIEESEAVTAVSQFLKRETQNQFGTQRHIDVIYNFIDLDRFRPLDSAYEPCPRKHLAPKGEKLLMHISNLRPVKRVRDVVTTFDLVRREVDCRLIVMGDGPGMGELRSQVHSLGLDDHVVLLGRQDRVEDLLPCGDLLLLPSEHESFGMAALESMACGVPVISTQGSGVSEVVVEGQSGMLYPVGDCESMAAAAIDILQDPARHDTMCKAARNDAKRFDIARIIPEYEQLYSRVLSAAPAAR